MQVGEAAAISFLTDHSPNCELCKKRPPPERKTTNIEASPNDDSEAIGNDAGELDANMDSEGDPRPEDWIIDIPGKDHLITPNPHHLIPGNESLKKSSKLLAWLFESKKRITEDVGYDVNGAENGKWLPSNNSMRGHLYWTRDKFRREYAIQAMQVAGGHFHDRHTDYSRNVTKILNKIADRLNAVPNLDSMCPMETRKKGGKYEPPIYLIYRLNGVSGRLARFLSSTSRRQDFFYTSKLVRAYWDEMETPRYRSGNPL